MEANSKETVINFIEVIWNQSQFDQIDRYIHPNFTDHSLPPMLPTNKDGLKLWITGTSQAFEHETIIEEIVCEDNKVMVKILMSLKHIGKWRDIEPTGKQIFTNGYRYFKLADNKIIEHWALVDGNAIENDLMLKDHRCKV